MKRILLLSLLVAAMTLNVNAQKMSWDKDTTKASISSTSGLNDYYAEAFLTNHSYEMDTFVWVRHNVVKPSDWSSAVCDVNICHDTIVDSMAFVLKKGETGYFALHFYAPSGDGGNASMDITIYNKGDRSSPINLTAQVFTWATSTKEVTSANMEIYPNPAKGKVNIELPISTTKSIQMDVINVVGQNVQTIQYTGNGLYDVSTLDPGIYFLKFKVNGKQIVKKFQIAK